jgi:hypothetical protein
MKPQKDHGFDSVAGERDPAAQGPLRIEPLGRQGGKGRRYGLQLAIAGVVVIAMLAMVSRFTAYFAPGPTASPSTSPNPSPGIAWIPATADPTLSSSDTSVPQASQALVKSIQADIPAGAYYWSRGTDNHFTVNLTNTSGAPITLSPCPTYRMFIVPDDGLAPIRLLNCPGIESLIGQVLDDGQTISLDMVFRPTTADPLDGQQLEWVWQSPTGYQALALVSVYIGP